MTRASSLRELKEEAASCTACPLHGPATQTVFGEGTADARIMMVGEQPGDQEDLQGRPFVGPAGQLLDRALDEAALDRSTLYVTNAVKHFKFAPRGKRRIHQKPESGEIEACRFWLLRETETLDPALIVALGATAARAVFNRVMAIGKNRGRFLELPDARRGFITVHPSYLLRLPDERTQRLEYERFVDDLRMICEFAANHAGGEEARERTGEPGEQSTNGSGGNGQFSLF